ncbi:MAG: hypothetical protein ACRDYY_06655 [Acidimicrobiales bacterium]
MYEAAVERNDWDAALSIHRRIVPLAEYLLTHCLSAPAKVSAVI